MIAVCAGDYRRAGKTCGGGTERHHCETMLTKSGVSFAAGRTPAERTCTSDVLCFVEATSQLASGGQAAYAS